MFIFSMPKIFNFSDCIDSLFKFQANASNRREKSVQLINLLSSGFSLKIEHNKPFIPFVGFLRKTSFEAIFSLALYCDRSSVLCFINFKLAIDLIWVYGPCHWCRQISLIWRLARAKSFQASVSAQMDCFGNKYVHIALWPITAMKGLQCCLQSFCAVLINIRSGSTSSYCLW